MTDFLHSDLGHQGRDSTVVVKLEGNQANVRLMDGENYESYMAGHRHTYYGGLATASPVRLQVPSDGHWHVIVDLEGLRGKVNASISIESSAKAPVAPTWRKAVPRSPLARMADELAAVAPESPAVPKPHDVFIAHSRLDKYRYVADLARELRKARLEVDVDDFTLRPGEDPKPKIDAGLATSRFGVILLTPNFFQLPLTDDQLDELVTRKLFGERQVVLPIWHSVKDKDVAKRGRSLADRLSLSTAKSSVAQIAEQIAKAVRHE